MSLAKKVNHILNELGKVTVQLLDAIQVAEKVIEDAEAMGFINTAEAMRQVLTEMALTGCAPRATNLAADSILLN